MISMYLKIEIHILKYRNTYTLTESVNVSKNALGSYELCVMQRYVNI